MIASTRTRSAGHNAVAVQQLAADRFAQHRIDDQHRHDMARARHHRQPGLGEAALQCGRALLMAHALGAISPSIE